MGTKRFYAKAIYENNGSDFDVLFESAYNGIPIAGLVDDMLGKILYCIVQIL